MKNLLLKFKNDYSDYLKNHMVTNIFLLITVFLIMFYEDGDVAERLLAGSIATSIFTLFSECFTKERNVFYVVSILLGIIVGFCVESSELSRIIFGVLLITVLGIVYLMMRNSKVSSDKYIRQVFTNLFKAGIIGVIINIGIMLVVSLFSGLIYELDYDVFSKLEAIIFIVYFIPAGIISLEKIDEGRTKLIYVLNNYVLLPLVSIATLIVYLYIIKLIVTFALPETSIFGVLALLLVFAIPTVIMVLSYGDDNIFNKIADLLRYMFIPLLVLQAYAILLRISEHGITSSRYVAVMVLLFGVFSVAFLIREKGKNFKFVLIPCMVFALVGLVIPYINVEEFPNYMQIKRLVKIMPEGTDFDSLTFSEKEDVLSIVRYVSDEEYYPSYINRRKLLYSYDKPVYMTISYYPSDRSVDVSDYVRFMNYTSYRVYDFKIEIDDESYDISDYVLNVYNYYVENGDIYDYMDSNNVIRLSKYIDFYITGMSLRYDEDYLSLQGYILYRDGYEK